MSDFFFIQLDYVFFVYGLSFVLLAAVLRTVRDKEPDFPWSLLGLFGLLHGLCEWGDMLAISLGDSDLFTLVRLGLMWVSYLILARFGLEALGVSSGRKLPGSLVAVFGALCLWGGFFGLPGLAASVRLGLALPGALCASAGLWLYAMRQPRCRFWMHAAAAAMGVYALLAGAVFQPVPELPRFFGLEPVFARVTGMPVQVMRAACAGMLAVAIWLYFVQSVRQREDRHLDRSIWNRRRSLLLALVVVLSAGWLGALHAGRQGLRLELTRYENHFRLISDNLTQHMLTADRVSRALSTAALLRRASEGTAQALDGVNEAMDRFAGIIPGSVVYFMDVAGKTLASSNRDQPGSFVGFNFGFREYFREALASGQGQSVAVGSVTHVPGYYSSVRVDRPDGQPAGVAVVKVELTTLHLETIRDDLVFLINRQGLVLASSHKEFDLRQLWPMHPGDVRELLETKFSPKVLAELLDEPPVHGEMGRFLGERRVVLRMLVGLEGLELVLLGSLEQMWLPRLLVICITLLFSIVLLLVFVNQERIRMDAARLAERNAELDQALIRVEEAARAKGMFLANMSHEIRTPLNGVLGMLTDLADSPLTPEQAQSVAVALESGRNLLRVVGDILDFTKVEAGKLEFRREPVNPMAMAEAVLQTFKPEAVRKGLELTLEAAEDLPEAFLGDEVRIRQVLYNLVGNAMKFTAQGRVTLRLEKDPDRDYFVRLTVSDTGEGIPAHMLEGVFEAFTQVDGSSTRVHGGSGLGLAIVRALVRGMGGETAIASRLGEGTTVLVSLPAAPCRAMPRQEAPDEAMLPEKTRPMHILLVEDDRINQLTARRFLDKWGHTVSVASNGREALDILAGRDFDLILLDMQMPVLDGLSTLRLLRSEEVYARHASTPVVALTAHAMKGDRERYLAEGLDDYLSKPFDVAEFKRVLSRAAVGRA